MPPLAFQTRKLCLPYQTADDPGDRRVDALIDIARLLDSARRGTHRMMKLTANEYAVVSRLLVEALSLPQDSRADWIDRLLGPDAAFKAIMSSLIAASASVTSEDFLSRLPVFSARERDILAALAHPGIARLYDAGLSSAGQPYLALEFVEAQPITVHCDARRLNVRQRISLFLGVILYELLCGQRPYRRKRDTPLALEDAIVDSEAVRPSRSITDLAIAGLRATTPKALTHTLKGDLDTILLVAHV